MSQSNRKLSRGLGLPTLVATGVCSMFGASIYIVPFMIQKNIPGIGQWVLFAFLFAAIPALLSAMSYASLSSAMPRAGGSYIYASRGLHPYLGFIASFSQWFGLSIVIGVIAYVIIPFLRDICIGIGLDWLDELLENGVIRVSLSLGLIWIFVWINIKGLQPYKKVLLPMMFLMIALASIVIIAGILYDSQDFLNQLETQQNKSFLPLADVAFDWKIFLSAAALLFSSFIGFDSIAQAGSEAKHPTKYLPKAIILAIVSVGIFYFCFAASVYHIVPWSFVAEEATRMDVTAPGLLNTVLPSSIGVIILLGAAVALINDLPAMLLSVSRLMFAWSADRIFPKSLSVVHPRYQTPYKSLITAGLIASIGVLGSHFAGDFFLGIDIMVTAMMVNFLLMCITLLLIPKINPELSSRIVVFQNRPLQLVISIAGILLLILFLIIHTSKDLSADVSAWYFHSTYVYLIVMGIGSVIYFLKWNQLQSTGIDTKVYFKKLPSE